MKPITIIASLLVSAAAFAGGPDWLVGSYRLEVAPEVKSTAQKLGMAEPYVRIMLRPDGTFSYASNTNGSVSAAGGTYDFNDRELKLVASGTFPGQGVKVLTGTARDGQLVIDGLRYVKAGSVNLVGTWTVRVGDREDKSIRLTFGPDKSFKFVCIGANSKGKYELDGDRITLVWTEVDGESVEFGSMRKVIFLREDGTFNIDSYRYAKG